MQMKIRVVSVLLALIGLACSPAVFSQATERPPAERSAPGLSAPSYSDSELKSFAVAVLEVQRINNDYVPKLESAKSPEEQMQIRKTASQEMVRAVEKEGMSVEKYKEIMSQAETNPAIAERVKAHMQSSSK